MFDLDKIETEIECPLCKFYNNIFMKQIRIRDVIICRGCNGNIQLDDYMNTFRKVKSKIDKQMKEFQNILNLKIEL